jgi:DNA-binding SARP family transcriptional activator
MDFRILGPLEVRSNGHPIPLGGTKRRALLAALLLNANEVVSSDRLIDELWGEDPPETAAKALQVHISGLRKALEPDRAPGEQPRVLVTRPPGYVLQAAEDALDLHRFERLRAAARADLESGDAASAAARLREALSLWRGPALDDLAFEPSLQGACARLDEMRLAAVEERIAADLRSGAGEDLIAELEALLAANPLRERPRAQLMLALYRAGRQADALELYRSTREMLVDELGLDPGRELQDLHRAILAHDPALDPAAPASGRQPSPPGVFVGREEELERLVAQARAAHAGRAGVALIAGEPGIGKSRLAEALAAEAERMGATVHWGRCWEAGGAPAYWPWVQSLRALIGASDPVSLRTRLGDDAGELARIVPELADVVPEIGSTEPWPDTDGARFRMFEAIARFLTRASAARPIVLVLDDMHAADEPSMLLLRFVGRELAAARVLVVAVYRDVELHRGHPLRAAVAELRRDSRTAAVTLLGLERGDVDRLIQVTESVRAPAGVVDALYEQTDGNPLFVSELVRLLAARGDLARDEPGHVTVAGIPDTVRDTIASRAERLSPECSRVLVAASVIGREFSPVALERVTSHSGAELADLLEEAAAARLVERVPGSGSRLRFSHALIRDALYDQILPGKRLRMHRRLGEAFEEMYRGQGEHLAEIAHHFVACAALGDAEKAVEYARAAGDRAAAMYAHEEAARHFEAGLAALETALAPDLHARGELLLALGDAHARAGVSEQSKRAFRRAAELADRAHDADQLARAALGYGGRSIWGRAATDPELVPLLESALEALGPEDQRLRACVLARLGGATRRQKLGDTAAGDRRDTGDRGSPAREALAIARRLGDDATLAYALEGYEIAILSPASLGECREIATETIALAERTRDPERLFGGYENRFFTVWALADMRTAADDFVQMTRLAEAMRQPAQLWVVQSSRAMRALSEGRLADARELIGATFDQGRLAQTWNAAVTNAIQTYMFARAERRLGDVEAMLAKTLGEHPTYSPGRCAMVHVKQATGDTAAARRALDKLAPSDFGAVPFDEAWLFCMTLLAEATAALGDAGHCAALHRLLSPYGGLIAVCPSEACADSVARPLGLLAAALGRDDEAEAHLLRALEMNETVGARPAVAETQLDYAGLLQRRGRPEDHARADGLIRDALATYESLGMHAAAREAVALVG